MEHRWSMRKLVDGHVTLSYPPLGILNANIRDLSLGGLFVHTHSAVLNINTPVELLFVSSDDDAQKIYHVEALVVRKTDEGAGLMFHKFNNATFRILNFFLLSDNLSNKTVG